MSRRRSGLPAGTRSAFAPASARRRAYAARITYGGSPPAALKSARTAARRTAEGGVSVGPGPPAPTSPASIAPAVAGTHPEGLGHERALDRSEDACRRRSPCPPRAERPFFGVDVRQPRL